MPTLTITRDGPMIRDRVRAYQVLIDGRQEGFVHDGETAEFYVSRGLHHVGLKIDWCGSPTLSVDVGAEGAELECGPNWPAWHSLVFPLLLWQATFGRKRWISLRPASPSLSADF